MHTSFYKNMVLWLAGNFWVFSANAQDLYNNIPLAVKGTATLYVAGNFSNASSAVYVNDASVTIKGNIANSQASMSQGSGTTYITGSSVQSLSGSEAFVVNNVTLENTSSGSGNITFSNNLTVGGIATFIDGIVLTNSNKMSFLNGANYTGAANISHVNGFVEKTGNVAFTFPVGDGTLLRPASIGAPSAASDVFIGKYIYATPNPTYNTSSKAAVLDTVSNCEYWTIQRTTGSSNVKVTLTWENPNSSCLQYTNPPDVYVSGWDGTLWQSFANGGTTGNSSKGTVISNIVSNTFSAFALAKRNIPLPISLTYFNAFKTLEGNKLNWETASEKNTKMFVIERSCEGNSWTFVGSMPSNSISKNHNQYSLIDLDPCSELTYYKLAETSIDGSQMEYDVVVVDNTSINKSIFELYPNPGNGFFHVRIAGDAQRYNMELTDASGRAVGSYILSTGNNTIDCSAFAAGLYLAQFTIDDNKVVKKLVLR